MSLEGLRQQVCGHCRRPVRAQPVHAVRTSEKRVCPLSSVLPCFHFLISSQKEEEEKKKKEQEDKRHVPGDAPGAGAGAEAQVRRAPDPQAERTRPAGPRALAEPGGGAGACGAEPEVSSEGPGFPCKAVGQ